MGSLVVCLPVAHKGGQIAFRHDGQQVEFDGASQHSETIQWAAFLSACEHEVLPITEGHRVMLTYNLVWSTWGHGFMANQRHILDQESTHFYTDLEKLIEKIKSTGERKQSRPFVSLELTHYNSTYHRFHMHSPLPPYFRVILQGDRSYAQRH